MISFDQLTKIRTLIRLSLLPWGISRPPALYGVAAAGTLTAAHWRTLGLLIMPITLIDFWAGGIDEGVEPQGLQGLQALPYLVCYLDLVCLTRLAFSRCMSKETIEGYHHHHTRYITALGLLYQDQKPKPNQHMLSHVPEYMVRFGPLVNLSAFTYEGLQGQNQRQTSNHKPSMLVRSLMIEIILHNFL